MAWRGWVRMWVWSGALKDSDSEEWQDELSCATCFFSITNWIICKVVDSICSVYDSFRIWSFLALTRPVRLSQPFRECSVYLNTQPANISILQRRFLQHSLSYLLRFTVFIGSGKVLNFTFRILLWSLTRTILSIPEDGRSMFHRNM
jgi:hypothetical protein